MMLPITLYIEVDGVRTEIVPTFTAEPFVITGSGAPAKIWSEPSAYRAEQVTPGTFTNEDLKTILPGKRTVYFNFASAQTFIGQVIDYRVSGPELAYIPATAEPGQPSGDNPAAFAPILKADGIGLVRIWTDLLASYGNIEEWAAAGLKPLVTTTFKEGNWTLAQSCAPALYANNLATTAQRLRNAAIVQYWNEPQFGWYYPSDVTRDVAGLKRIFNEYYKPLSQSIGRGRMAGPSVLPHYQGAQWLRMLVDAGFYDPAYTTYADFHLYFGRWASKQEVIDGVSACKAILPAGIKLISTEFGKDINDTLKVKDAQGRDTSELDYTTGNLQEIYATYATLGFSPMAHFMGGTMNKFAAHTKGIYSRTGQRINDDVRACVRKVGAKVQQVVAQS